MPNTQKPINLGPGYVQLTRTQYLLLRWLHYSEALYSSASARPIQNSSMNPTAATYRVLREQGMINKSAYGPRYLITGKGEAWLIRYYETRKS